MRAKFRPAGALALLLASAASSAAPAKTISVEIAKLAFAPAELSAHVGDTIEWTNGDFVAHTATARDKRWDITIPVHGTGSVVLKGAGTIEYYCRFHPNMKGTITVDDKPAE